MGIKFKKGRVQPKSRMKNRSRRPKYKSLYSRLRIFAAHFRRELSGAANFGSSRLLVGGTPGSAWPRRPRAVPFCRRTAAGGAHMDAQAGMLARLFESESESTPIPFTPLRRPRDGLLRMPRPELLGAEVPQRRVDLDPVAEALDVLEGLRRRSLSRLSLRRPSAIWNGLPSAGYFGDGCPMPPPFPVSEIMPKRNSMCQRRQGRFRFTGSVSSPRG